MNCSVNPQQIPQNSTMCKAYIVHKDSDDKSLQIESNRHIVAEQMARTGSPWWLAKAWRHRFLAQDASSALKIAESCEWWGFDSAQKIKAVHNNEPLDAFGRRLPQLSSNFAFRYSDSFLVFGIFLHETCFGRNLLDATRALESDEHLTALLGAVTWLHFT